MAYAILNFADHRGRPLIAKIPIDMYEELLLRARITENDRFNRPTYQEPSLPGGPQYIYRIDDGGKIRRTIDNSGRGGYFNGEQRFTYSMNFNSKDGEEAFNRIYEEFFGSHSPKPQQRRTTSPSHQKLCDILGVEPIDNPPSAGLLRRAKRKCHPDTGGGKEQWLELERIAKNLGLAW
ncbi:MAG: hypothetical protein E6Q68_07580 [Polynucleobacter sp.]|nr:MAG: hypothetical protein E6Q68_07580 [Polynucleobacter sp.]